MDLPVPSLCFLFRHFGEVPTAFFLLSHEDGLEGPREGGDLFLWLLIEISENLFLHSQSFLLSASSSSLSLDQLSPIFFSFMVCIVKAHYLSSSLIVDTSSRVFAFKALLPFSFFQSFLVFASPTPRLEPSQFPSLSLRMMILLFLPSSCDAADFPFLFPPVSVLLPSSHPSVFP